MYSDVGRGNKFVLSCLSNCVDERRIVQMDYTVPVQVLLAEKGEVNSSVIDLYQGQPKLPCSLPSNWLG